MRLINMQFFSIQHNLSFYNYLSLNVYLSLIVGRARKGKVKIAEKSREYVKNGLFMISHNFSRNAI